MEEGKTKKGGRNRRRRKEERRKEKSEDEGGGKSKVKPVTEWAGMTDWVVAVRKWMPGSGEEFSNGKFVGCKGFGLPNSFARAGEWSPIK